ncbi:bifunctional 5,10-methylenetetrahydrofolate dehydrogenase/5,10-methenyltetrahydrofolate cyclohydrolase [Candidatus Saccharibacteria bacterium]|nr:bifunctional 5,10-methylenetetrahydrofolate dehydrogenase/5,10-methenyltetrahydrofolate cyclohydrolase [Candidatus Saccharibacteria bacterium]
MKLLNGADLASYIKQRQASEVRSIVQSLRVVPKLVIIRTNPDPIVDTYMHLKERYGADIGIEVQVETVNQNNAIDVILGHNKDKSVHGIIVQIPLPDVSQTDEILNTVDPSKDVDGLATKTLFDPATPVAINWLLAGYNIDLSGKNIVLVGNGRLVGRPLAKIWQASDLSVTVTDSKTDNLSDIIKDADILVCATGVPGIITAKMVKDKAVIVDAGVATDSNGLVGDVSKDVRNLSDITITPEKGGVGPLTVCALFENVIKSARAAVAN